MKTIDQNLVGIGLYTPAEAGRLIRVPVTKLTRWLRGHEANGRRYEPLWQPQVDLGDDKIYLSFRDLLEARMASRFITEGLSPQKVRLAIGLAKEVVGEAATLNVLAEDGWPGSFFESDQRDRWRT